MAHIDYNLLDALHAVIRNGSFETAAKSLNVTQSAVSHRVKQLEERLGGTVVIRGRPCVPTELGQELCRHLDQVHLLEHQLNRRLGEQTTKFGSKLATIKIAVNADSLFTWFPSVIQRISKELAVYLDISMFDQDHTNQALINGEALAAITSGGIPIKGFRRLYLGSMDYVAVARPEFVSAYFPDGCTQREILAAPALSFDKSDTLPKQWLISAFDEDLEISGHRIPSILGYLKGIKNGIGWGLMPTSTVAPQLANGSLLEIIPSARISVPLHWQATTASSELLSNLTAIVIAEAKSQLNQEL